jgi:anthranilate synthase component II
MEIVKHAKGKTVIIDNYDSFTYNLVHILNEVLEEDVTVIRNDEFELEDLEKFDYIILSPGPGIPDEAGLLKDVIKYFGPTKKIFGVCLGLQAIGEVYGGNLVNLSRVFHGIKSEIHQTNYSSPILENVPTTFEAGRYHSWVLDKNGNNENFNITCIDATGEIMGIDHKTYQIFAVQFHPESIMTAHGKQMIINFLKIK